MKLKKTFLLICTLCCVLALALGFAGCFGSGGGDNNTDVPVTGVGLNKTSVELEIDETYKIKATVLPSNATNVSLSWQSSAPTVATVNLGVITAKAEGTANITVSAGEKIATCTVKVRAKGEAPTTVHVQSVTLNAGSLSLQVDGTATLTATVKPDNAVDKTVDWESSNENIATVVDGKVTAKAAGTATITATADGKSATCSVTVVAKGVEIVPVSGVTLNKPDLDLKVGDTATLTASVAPENATDKTVSWSSSNQSVATVENGVVTAKAAGTAKITAQAGDKTAVCEVGVSAGTQTVDPVNPDKPTIPDDSILTYAHAGEESAAFEWKETAAANAKVEYKLSTATTYTSIDKQLIRQISSTTARADILGLKGGAKYDFKITTSENKASAVTGVDISALDRSGYAHFNYTNGVGAYKDDGTLKSNAQIIYVTEQNKNNIDGNGTSIAQYLSKAGNNSKPIVVRIIGTVGAATWKKGNVTYTKTSSNTDSSGNLLPSAIVGANGKALDKKGWTQAELISGGYNVLDTGVYAELKGLSSSIKWDSSKNEFDSCWNDCQVKSVNNITVEGVGEDAEIFQWGFTFKSCNSVEVRNIRFYDYTEDACSVEGGENATSLSGFKHKNFWIHHNTFDIGVNYWDVCKEQDKHDGDGSTDFKYLAYITVAYNRYNGTHKTGLVGGGDSAHQACFTFHHNYYNGCDQRMPLGRQANMHIYNNYFYKSGLYSVSLRAGAYAFVENCVFTYKSGSTKPIELVKGSNGTPSCKVIDCDLGGRSVTNGVGAEYLYVGSDRTKTVKGSNLYGLNFEQQAGFYTVTNKLDTNKVATEIPKLAGVMKRDLNIKVEGGSEVVNPPVVTPNPPVTTPDDPADNSEKVTMNVAEAISANKLQIGDGQNFDNVTLAEGIALNTTGSKTKVTAHTNQFDDGRSFTHRIVLKGTGNYFKISVDKACTVKVYVANGSTTDTTGREIGLYTDTAGKTLMSGATTTKLVGGDKQAVVYNVTKAGTYYLESITNELSIYQIEIIYS